MKDTHIHSLSLTSPPSSQSSTQNLASAICWFVFQMTAWPSMSHAEARHSSWVSHMGDRDPYLLVIFWCFLLTISRELGWKWSSQDMNWPSYEKLVSQAVVYPTMSQCQSCSVINIFKISSESSEQCYEIDFCLYFTDEKGCIRELRDIITQ